MEVKFYSTDGRELLLGFGNSGLLATVKETGTPYHGGLTAKAEGQNSGNGSECNCNCMMQPYYVVRYGVDITQALIDDFSFYMIANEIHLSDLLPPDQCPGQKAIVFLMHHICYCEFHSQDGWIIVTVSKPQELYQE